MADKLWRVQLLDPRGRWFNITGGLKGYCQGWLDAYLTSPPPLLGARLVSPKGEIGEESPERSELDIGLIAGFPSTEQYVRASVEALRRGIKAQQWARSSAGDHADPAVALELQNIVEQLELLQLRLRDARGS